MNNFGRTWWGGQWLRALDRIDFSNRLPRGSSYARKGAVNSIKFNKNLIKAKVQGTRKTPYNIRIVVPPFFEEERELFMKNIRENPLVLSRLLNRQLPNELLDIGEQNNVKIFPESWQDIKLNCDCPDWAVPCKHLAAVIYMIANEIDQNPFLVFQLHDFDILGELKKLNIRIENLKSESVFSIKDCIRRHKVSEDNLAEINRDTPDFSTIEDLLPVIPPLFRETSLFYSGDLKAVLEKVYKRAARQEDKRFREIRRAKEPDNNDLRYQDFRVLFSTSLTLEIEMTDEAGEKSIFPFDKLIFLLAKTDLRHLENYSPSYIALYKIFRYCNILVERGAILPQLFHCGYNDYKILWQPALLNDSVKTIFDQVLQWLPEDLVWIRKPGRKTKINKQPSAQVKPTKKPRALQLLCSLFLNRSIRNSFIENTSYNNAKSKEDKKILELFFNDQVTDFSGFYEKEIPNSIQLWLKRFFISEKAFIPVISVRELEESFEVETMVKYNNGKLQVMEQLSVFLDSASDENKMVILKDLNILSDYFPDLNKVILSGGKEKLEYEAEKFSDVLMKILPALRLFGIKALLPKSLQNLLRPQVSLQLTKRDDNKSYFSLDELMSFNWKVAIGDSFLTREEFDRLSKSTFGLVKIRDQYVMMDESDVARVIRALENPAIPNSFQLLQAALSGEYDNAPVQVDNKLKIEINNILKIEDVQAPGSLRATLRPYQQRGFNWLYKNSRLGMGSLLADDMGLGKTLQVITTLLKFKEEGVLEENPALVVVPTTLLTNWVNEIQKFAPALRTHVFHGTNRKFIVKDIDVMITTYGLARSENKRLNQQMWHVMVVDEAQNIKNPLVEQSKAVKRIKAKNKIALSGTPVENRLSEYWSIFDFANPGYLGGINWFAAEYAKPIELNQDRKKLEKFKQITAPFITRRIKTDKKIISDLPDKIESNQFCHLSKEQAAIYKNVTQDLMLAVEDANDINRQGLVLKLLGILKQVCNHPAQYLKNDIYHPELSGKMMMLLQLLENIYENNEKVLIFSQYREMGDILQKVIYDHFGKKSLQLHGGCSRKQRDQMVQSFQDGHRHDTFILSLKAGGTGLNLTAAANVIHYDLWWNPAVEAQATDRAFRIGQKQNVMVHRMITKGTLEEKIDRMIREKKHLANLTVSTGEKWIGELSDKELKSLVALGEEQVSDKKPELVR